MNFKLILHGLMLTTSALTFLSSPLVFGDDTPTLKEKEHDYSLDDNRILDVPEYVKATGKNKEGLSKAQKEEVASTRQIYKEKASDYLVSFKHIDDALQSLSQEKRRAHRATPKEFSGAHWATDEKFCFDKLGLKEGETLTGNKTRAGIFVNAAPHSKEDKVENRGAASSNAVGLRSLTTQIAPRASVELYHNRELVEKNAQTPDIIQYIGYDTLTDEELDNFSKNTEGKLLITAWGDTFGKVPSQSVMRLLNKKTVRDGTIFVVNVDDRYKPDPSSNLPSEKERNQQMRTLRERQGQSQQRIEETLKGLQENTLSALGSDVWYFAGTDGTKKNETELGRRVINGKIFERGDSGNYAAALVSGAAALVMEFGKEKGVDLLPSEVQWLLLNSARKSGFTTKIFRYRDLWKAEMPDYKDSIDYKPDIILSEEEFDEQATKEKTREQPNNRLHRSVYKKFDPKVYGRGFLDVRRALLLTKLFCEAKKKSAFSLNQVPQEILEEFNASEKKESQAAAEKIAGALKIAVAKRLKETKRKEKAQEEEKKRKAEQQQKEDDEQAMAGVDRPRSKQMSRKEAAKDAKNIKKTIEDEKK